MLYLIGSIILTSYLTLSFKVVGRYNIPVLQAIVFNYWACVLTGSVVHGSFPVNSSTFHEPWFTWALVMGGTFFFLFNIIGFTAQRIGVAVASVANKLSLVIPFVFSIYLYNEKATALKIAGIVMALAAVVFTCWPHDHYQADKKSKPVSPLVWISVPAVLFIGSGLLDTMVKYVEQGYLNETNNNTYLITSFAVAGTVGLVTMLILMLTGKQKFDHRSIAAGIAIGIPNYFSIWCLVNVLKLYASDSSRIIPINNMGIVLFSAVVAMFLFREKLSKLNWLGIALSLGAIALIAYG